MVKPEEISSELMTKLTGKIDFLYNEIPITVPVNDSPFVVCSVDSAITDNYAYSYTISSLYIFVKNLANGTHNSKKINIAIDSISSIFPIKSNNYLFNTLPTVIPMGNDSKGYNVTKIQIETFIYKQ